MSDVWYTWHDTEFDCEKYLYHYTSVEKASKILYYQTLRFSPIVNTNDTIESKVRLEFQNGKIKGFTNKKDKIKKYMQKYNEHLQLLCFSKDESRDGRKGIYTKEDDRFFADMARRGFALPRMWAQYADNNQGVCLIINREKLENELNQKYDVITLYSDSVTYKDAYDNFVMSTETIENLADSISEDPGTTVNGLTFLKGNIDYLRYAFFTKYIDWKNENEYRYLIGSDNKKAKEIKNLFNYLEGVVIGEKIDEVSEWTIKLLVNNLLDEKKKSVGKGSDLEEKISVKKICFDYNCCQLIGDCETRNR